MTIRGKDVSSIRREVVSSWRTRKSETEDRKLTPGKVGQSYWIFTNLPTYTPYYTEDGSRVCARVLHIPYPAHSWASLDASVASGTELCRALELSGIPSLREIASFEFNRFPHSYISLVSRRLTISKLLIVLRKIGGLISCHSFAVLRKNFWVTYIYINILYIYIYII